METNAPHPVKDLLAKVSNGLLMPSETDVPFTPFFWPGDGTVPEADEIAELAGIEEDGVEEEELDDLLDPATSEEDWKNAEEKKLARRFQQLQETLEDSLAEIQVFIYGERRRTVVIIGRVKEPPSGVAGLITEVVET
jgi:hypothetical protein